MDRALIFSIQALKYCTVFTVYRKNPDTHLLCERHNDVTGSYQSLLIGKSDIFPCFHGRNGGPDSYHSNYCSDNNL